MAKIAIKGLERSGTGYVCRLVRQNYKNRCQEHEYVQCHCIIDETRKHFIDWTPENCAKYIVVVKNPYSWISSFLAYANSRRPTNLDRKPTVKQSIELWNRAYNFWLYDKQPCTFLRYEDILFCPKDISLAIDVTSDTDYSVTEYINNYAGQPAPDGKFSRQKFYIDKEYLKNKNIVNEVNNFIDKKLLRKFGYKICY